MPNNSFYKIYSGDYSKDGYEKGVEDAKNQTSKNKFSFFKAVNPVNYVWKFSDSYDSYMNNYDTGYLDGQRVTNEIYNDTNQTKGTTMALNNINSGFNTPSPSNQPPNISQQIQFAEDLYQLFMQAKNDINDVGGELYNLQIHGQNMMIEEYYIELVENHIVPRLVQFRNLIANIESNDLVQLKIIIDNLYNLHLGAISGATASTKFYNYALGNITAGIPSMKNAISNGSLNDFMTQIRIMQDCKAVLEGVLDALDKLGRHLYAGVQTHGIGMFKEHFNPFFNNYAQPRLEELKALYNRISQDDIPLVEKMIAKLQKS
ncbi:MAG: hypothetical protein PHW18_06020 [Sulfuricurvum sp.]|uniref:hypothetical protein n=1 Tax=Sulfuricurvum sp. TaxID=2025608 RepID=UPI0026260733|nr:hypothetical protein [Sulfuricurvum sp.]MDD2829113.1 hypothetical protein [Sulfuricurvum sp.]MDD4948861.1 hypothetical protein [Sulfuricurvum sp.]